jgi:hypothetical protein
MSFQLTITFAGMCLLVHDKKEDRLHVLLPPTGLDGGDNHQHDGGRAGGEERKKMPTHVARLIYDPVHEQPNGTPSGTVRVKREDDVPLEHTAWDLTGLPAGSRFEPEMPDAVVNLAQATTQPVSRSLFQGDTDGRVLSRVSIARGAAGKPHGGSRFRLGGRPGQHMATAIEWNMDVEGDFLLVDLRAMGDDSSNERQLELHPTKDHKLNLYIFHAPEDDLPDSLPPVYKTAPDEYDPPRADHFAAYYDLIDGIVGTPPVPVYDGPAAGETEKSAGMKGLKIICITATATV